MRNLIILGDTPFAERLYHYISFEGVDKVIAFTQESDFVSHKEIQGLPVLPFEELSFHIDQKFEIILGIGYTKMNFLKKKLYDLCVERGYKVGTYISTEAISYTDNIGEGCFLAPRCLVGPGCSLGKGNYLASAVVLSHDNMIGDFNFISTNAVLGGYSKVGNFCFLGLHSTIKDSVEIADNTLIGSMSNVLKSIDYEGGVFVGNPAKQLECKMSINVKI